MCVNLLCISLYIRVSICKSKNRYRVTNMYKYLENKEDKKLSQNQKIRPKIMIMFKTPFFVQNKQKVKLKKKIK